MENSNGINRRFPDDILVEFKPTVGDEFQGALKTPHDAYDVYTFIKSSLPVSLYCGLGIGEVEQASSGDSGLRGTAFYRAREALEMCKKEKGFLRLLTTDALTLPYQTLNTMLRLMEAIEKAWTPRQREVIHVHRMHQDWKQAQLADHFGISEPTLSKPFRSARWSIIREAEVVVKHLLGAIKANYK